MKDGLLRFQIVALIPKCNRNESNGGPPSCCTRGSTLFVCHDGGALEMLLLT